MTKTLTSPLRLLALLALWLLMSLGLAQAATETITYFHNDVAGTPILATDATGSVVWKENYQPYGSRINNAPGGDNSQWFTGKPYDGNTGLSYFGARYYDPVIGRFTGMDPAAVDPGNIHGLNRYSYGNNNPYRYVDPDGRMAQEIFGAIVVVGVGYAVCPSCRQSISNGLSATIRAVQGLLHSETSESSGSKGDTAPPPQDAGGSTSEEKPSLIDPDRAKHILDGDKTGGGHRAGSNKPGKSEFPSDWSDEKVLGEISDVATDPKSSRARGRGGREVVQGARDGVDIEVIVDPNSGIVTGYPTNVPRNPR